MSSITDWPFWEAQFVQFLERSMGQGDVAHDQSHVQRVVVAAKQLAAAEDARLEIVLPAAWLHDCVIIPKNSPLRRSASTLAAQAAGDFLRACRYPAQYIAGIEHAIAAHSFSAGIVPQTIEAMVVQDADRLDALGAIGIARCLMLGGALGRQLYDPREPFPLRRCPDDLANSLDHFYVKLLTLADTMRTAAGRSEARARTVFMQHFLAQLGQEIGVAL